MPLFSFSLRPSTAVKCPDTFLDSCDSCRFLQVPLFAADSHSTVVVARRHKVSEQISRCDFSAWVCCERTPCAAQINTKKAPTPFSLLCFIKKIVRENGEKLAKTYLFSISASLLFSLGIQASAPKWVSLKYQLFKHREI